MTAITTRVHVKAGREDTFDHLIAFEQYPEFIKPLRHVTREPGEQQQVEFGWVAAGSEHIYRVDVRYDRPNTTLHWSCLDENEHSGSIEIRELNPRRSVLVFHLDLVPHGVLDRVGSSSRVLRARIEHYLHQFSAYAEEQTGRRPRRGEEATRAPSEKLFDMVFPTDETTQGR